MIEKNPLVSIIVPCYNHEKYIEECILSIVNQSYENIEIIVIDDGSKDKSAEILEQLAKKYDFYFETQVNQGVAKTLNKCLSYTTSNLVVSISSDDVLMPNAVSDFVSKYIEMDGNFSLIFGDSFLINDDSEVIKINKLRNIANENESLYFATFLDFFKYYRKDLLNSTYIGSYSSFLTGNYLSVGMMYNKQVLISIGGWNESLKLEDHELWLRLSKINKFEYTNTIVSKYRFHENNTIKQYKEHLAINTAEMLLSEKAFIKKYNTKNSWNKAYNDNLLRFLKYRKFKSFINYYDFKSSFLIYLFNKLLNKIGNKFE
jgi:glycosyltransferase involved in cell wall biosynthesis